MTQYHPKKESTASDRPPSSQTINERFSFILASNGTESFPLVVHEKARQNKVKEYSGVRCPRQKCRN